MATRIRPAAPGDVALILDLIRGLAAYEQRSDQCVANQARLAEHLFGDSPAAEVLIAEHDGQPAGFALFFTTFSTFLARPGLYLEDLFVYPDLRGRGIGLALMRRVARLAVERGCGRFEWSVLEWNEPALAFYKKIGARPVTGWTTQRLAGPALEALAAGPDG